MRKRDRADIIAVAFKRLQARAVIRVPNFNGSVFRRGNDTAVVVRERDRADPVAVALERS